MLECDAMLSADRDTSSTGVNLHTTLAPILLGVLPGGKKCRCHVNVWVLCMILCECKSVVLGGLPMCHLDHPS